MRQRRGLRSHLARRVGYIPRCQAGIKVTVTDLLSIRRVVTQFLRKKSHFSFIARFAIHSIMLTVT
jgi:hypothetical protein